MIHNVVSISGGKDSTAMALLAIERETENLHFVFADTGHEHSMTYEYVDYLSDELESRCGVGIRKVRADFTDKVMKKRETVANKWRKDGVPEERILSVLERLQPTGNPFLDLCIWKGRFPSTRARFCSAELKHVPIETQVIQPILESGCQALVSWQGVRADESHRRKDLPEHDVEFGQWEPEPTGHLILRPIIAWNVEQVFDMHDKHGVKPNPLYKLGMGRVGCMPCIHARKAEIRSIALRFPEEFERLAEWERVVSATSKRGVSTFFPADRTPGTDDMRSNAQAVKEWSLTSWGGRQVDLVNWIEATQEPVSCSSIYGLCE